jgi:hypothetical protein
MNAFEADDAYSQDNLFVEIKTDIDEFVHVLSGNPALAELKGQVDTMFQALESQYSNVNMTQRQIIDIRTKLKTNVKNKTEVTKSIEDDLERFETLKKECENYNLKIVQVKFEEEEKEKKLIDQKIEISRLIQKKENDTLANFSAKDVARKQELNSEKDKLELEGKEILDKKEQTFDRSYKRNLEKNEVEKQCQQKRKQLLELEKTKLDLERQIGDARVLKEKNDAEIPQYKKDVKKMNNLEKEKKELIMVLERLKNEHLSIKQTLEEYEEKKSKLKEKCNLLQKENDRLKREEEIIDTNINEAMIEKKGLEERLEEKIRDEVELRQFYENEYKKYKEKKNEFIPPKKNFDLLQNVNGMNNNMNNNNLYDLNLSNVEENPENKKEDNSIISDNMNIKSIKSFEDKSNSQINNKIIQQDINKNNNEDNNNKINMSKNSDNLYSSKIE